MEEKVRRKLEQSAQGCRWRASLGTVLVMSAAAAMVFLTSIDRMNRSRLYRPAEAEVSESVSREMYADLIPLDAFDKRVPFFHFDLRIFRVEFAVPNPGLQPLNAVIRQAAPANWKVTERHERELFLESEPKGNRKRVARVRWSRSRQRLQIDVAYAILTETPRERWREIDLLISQWTMPRKTSG